MNRNSVISIFLLTAFTFLLAHNFIPHHHHVDVVESKHHEHHSHGHGHHHHHDKDDADHKKNQKEKSHDEQEHDTHFSLTGFVFIHSELSNLYSKRKDSKSSFHTVLSAISSERSLYGLSIKEKPPLIRCKDITQPYFYSLSQRGPPSIV